MADPDIGQLAASVWEKIIGKTPNDVIFDSLALAKMLGANGFKEAADGGRLFELPLEYATNTTHVSIGEMDTLDTTRIDVFDAAQFQIKITAGTVVYSELEKLRAQAGNGKFDVLAAKLENGKRSHLNALNTQAWSDGTGNGSKDIGGMQYLISSTPTTGTVGGIARGTYTWWRNRQNSGAQSSSAYDNLRSSMRTTYNQCSLGGLQKQPTFALTTRTVFEGYESLLVANERFQNKSNGQGAFGNDVLKFKNADLSYDEAAPSGNLYMGNNEDLKWVYLKGGWMKLYPEVDPANQLANVQKVATFSNLVSGNPRHLGVVTAIS